MHIVFTRFPLESTHGGAEIQTLALMQGLQNRGHRVTFLGSCPTLLVLCKQMKIPFIPLDIGDPPVSFVRCITFFWRQIFMRFALRRSLHTIQKSHSIDAICMLSFSEKLLLTPVAIAEKIPVFWIEHDSIGRWLTSNPYLPTLRRLSASATTIAVSRLSTALYMKLGWVKSQTLAIPNGILPARFDSAKRKRRTRGGLLQIGCVARLAQEKGIDVLIESMRTLQDAELTVVGVGPFQKQLEQHIASLRIGDRVHIVPHIGDLGSFYLGLDVFVLPSRTHDPFGLVAAEAMLLGVPTIVTDCCGIAGELRSGTDAMVVRSNSVTALRSALRNLLDDARRRSTMAKNGMRKAHTTFTQEAMIDRYEEIFRAGRLY